MNTKSHQISLENGERTRRQTHGKADVVFSNRGINQCHLCFYPVLETCYDMAEPVCC